MYSSVTRPQGHHLEIAGNIVYLSRRVQMVTTSWKNAPRQLRSERHDRAHKTYHDP